MANDPFTSLQTPAPTFSEQQAIAMLRDRYGIEAALAPLASERDQNFLVTASDGSKYVLKFANASESAAITDFQIRGLLHVARAGTDFQVPRVIATNDGELMFEVESDSGSAHRVRLLSWLDGVPLRHAHGAPDGRLPREARDCAARLRAPGE
jgi:Ser/Thr protein kinase RdoA (MazF antagonist)